MLIEIIVAIVIIALGAGIVYYLMTRNKEGEYIWVGQGEDPFKKEE